MEVINPAGAGDFVLVCEHASHRIPAELNGLGLSDAAARSHIAWDPGALALAREMARALAAPLVATTVSRLVYDCNRPPEAADATPEVSEIYEVPGNRKLSAALRAVRVDAIYRPFRRTLSGVIDARAAAGVSPAVVTVHSFTPVWFGQPRKVQIGVLHDSDTRLADALLQRLHAANGMTIARNQPYGPEDGVTHTLRDQAVPRGLPNVMLEVRNDLIADDAGVSRIADLILPCLTQALADVGAAPADA